MSNGERVNPNRTGTDFLTSESGINPLNPHDALKHHFALMKNDFISYTLIT